MVKAQQQRGICLGDTLSLTAYSPDAVRYEWSKEGQTDPVATQAVLTVSEPGIYRVVCYNAEGCKSTPSTLTEVYFNRPILADDSFALHSADPVALNLLLNDSFPCTAADPGSFQVTRAPAVGTLNSSGTGLEYVPDPQFVGTDSFEYVVSDQQGVAGLPATVYLTYGHPLPVQILDLNAQRDGQVVALNWKALLEPSYRYLDLQKSWDQKSWERLHTESYVADEDVSTPLVYAHIDRKPYMGDNFYRVIAYGGIDTLYSEVRHVLFKGEFSVYPNPTRDMIHIRSGSDTIQSVQLADITGRVVLRREVHAQQHEVSMVGLASGNYHLYLKDEQGNSYHFLIVKLD